jgi:hypothetical protein
MIGVTRLPGLWVQCFSFRHCPQLPGACSDPVPPWSWRSSAPPPDRYRSAAANKRRRLTPADRVLWVASFPNLEGLALDTGYRQTRDGHRLARKGFRLFWTWKVRRGKPGRPRVSCEVRDLVAWHTGQRPKQGSTLNAIWRWTCSNCIVHCNVSWLSPSHEGCLRHRLGKPKQRCRLQLRAWIEGPLWGDLGDDQLVTLNASCTTTFSLANGRGVWPTGQSTLRRRFLCQHMGRGKAKNFTIDHNLPCFRGPAESDVLCAWSRDFGMRVDDGHRFLHISTDYTTY